MGKSALALVTERNSKRQVETEDKEIKIYDVITNKKPKDEEILTRKQGEYSVSYLNVLVAYKKLKEEKYPKQKDELQKLWDSMKDWEDPCMEAGNKIKESRSQSTNLQLYNEDEAEECEIPVDCEVEFV